MEETKPVYETDTEILSFAGSGRLFLCDDYRCNILFTEQSVMVPSVRHGVLWVKADGDTELQHRILHTFLPADLKVLELQIPAPKFWNRTFIKDLVRTFTYLKFWNNAEFRKELIATDPKILINGLMSTQGRYDIEEINDDSNVQGKILMGARRYFLGKYSHPFK